MKKIISLLALLFVAVAASAQIKTYADNETATFIIGLDSYFYGDSGSLGFSVKGKDMRAAVLSGTVSINGEVIEEGEGDIVIGTHDFTGDQQVELVVARRSREALYAVVYQYHSGEWKVIGRIGAADEGVREIRVFRQAFTIRNKRTNALYTWTYHAPKFDFKSSDGIEDPTPSL
ncbi:MAG: hypothetical protein IKR38_00600 [Bacteroidales bacterium]|nr:hypothetical protein [Bacteroidales bacterium]